MLTINQKQNTFNNRKNQALLEKKTTVEKRRGFVKGIVEYIISFRHAPFIKLSNERIAQHMGCSIRTVQRSTNWLHDQGLITKSQDNLFSINDYKLCREFIFDTKYEAYVNSLPETLRDRIMETIILPETVTPISSLYIVNSYLVTRNPYLTRITPARARVIDGDGYGKLTKRQREYRNRVGDALHMVQKEVREWVVTQKDNKSIALVLRDPKIGLISPVMQEVITVLKLTETDYLKMIPFDEPVLKAAWNMTKKVNALKDPMAFFLKACREQAKQQNFIPEWNWYYQVCQLLSIPVFKPTDVPDERPSDMYKQPEPVHAKPYQGISSSTHKREQTKSLTGMQKLTMLYSERKKAEENLVAAQAIPTFGIFTQQIIRKKMDELTADINQLEKELTCA